VSENNTKLEEIAQKDELTGLYNRRGFITNAERELEEPSNQGKVAIICYADMDNLKMINDKYGHDDGDFALKTIAHVLQESFRDMDIIGRIGGDEFISLAVTGSDCDVDSMKERIEKVTKRHNQIAGKPYPIEMSTGIYKFKIAGKVDIYEAMNNADRLLYDEKIRKKKGRQFNQ
jgi:diguanylate cyclase (GGDEF)-like protein